MPRTMSPTSPPKWLARLVATLAASALLGGAVVMPAAASGVSAVIPATVSDDVPPADEATEGSTEAPAEDPTEAPTEESTDAVTEESPVIFALGDPPSLGLTVTIESDGTPGWDADSAAGNDSSPTNGIVRVNDTVTYAVQYAVNGTTGEDTTFSLTFPKGMELLSIPGFCLAAGSSLVPATAGVPALPLHENSNDELNEQTLTCNLGDKSNVSEVLRVTAKALNFVPNGHVYAIQAAGITANYTDLDGNPATAELDAATLPEVTASSRLKWDISKNSISLTENAGYNYGPADYACPDDPARVCKLTTYSVLLSSPSGGKGAMPALGDVSFDDAFTPAAMYPSLTSAQHAAIAANPALYGMRIDANCGNSLYGQPGGGYGRTQYQLHDAVNSVRNNGYCNAVLGTPGTTAHVTISGTDWSLRTYPTEVIRPEGQALPAGQAYAYAGSLFTYTPVEVIRDFGITAGITTTLATRNDFTNLHIEGFGGAVQTSAEQPLWNDYKTTSPSISRPGGFSKAFFGVPGAEGNMSGAEFIPSNSAQGEGPAGGATYRSGGITVAPTQTITSQLLVIGSTPGMPGERGAVLCDAWDNTKLHYEEGSFPAGTDTPMGQNIPSNGEGVWISGYPNLPTGSPSLYASDVSQTPTIRVQYSATGGAGTGAASTCADSDGPWYSDPEDVPGNDATLASQDVFTGVARVRIFLTIPEPQNFTVAGTGVRVHVSIAQRVAPSGLTTGDIIPNWASVKFGAWDQDHTMESLLADTSTQWSLSTYVPGNTRDTGHIGSLGDRLIVSLAQARIDKSVRKAGVGEFSSTPPQVTGGDVVEFKLAPSLTNAATVPGILKDIWVEDCLPASVNYLDSSLTPSIVSLGSTPADADRADCAANETYVRWVIADHEVNQPVEPVIVSVTVAGAADDGVYTNTVQVWAEDDVSPASMRQSNAQFQIANIAGVKLEKIALTPVVQVNRPGQATNELNRWSVRLSNTLPASAQSNVNDPDIIDVLPRQGVAGTTFAGTFRFVEATITGGGDTVALLYTSAASVSHDPYDPSNGASGSTTWCDAPSGGTVVSGSGACPMDAATVTGIRIQRPGAFLTGEVISIELSMVGVGNVAGDTYVNRVYADAQGLEFPVGPIAQPEVVISSNVGDYTWYDPNRDGVQDSSEPVAADVPVTLTGTDDLGNAVTLSTTTDASGLYSFAGLRASDVSGYTITFGLPSHVTGFTEQNSALAAVGTDSNANVDTGEANVVLATNTSDVTIDAGYLVDGSLTITKLLSGAGVREFASDGSVTFGVQCAFAGESVLDTEAELTFTGDVALSSEPFTGLPVGAVCVVTEIDPGVADDGALPAPVTVTIPWSLIRTDREVTVSMTNYYSAGTVQLAKEVEGPAEVLEQVDDVEFTFDIVCAVEQQVEGEPVRSIVASGELVVSGGETALFSADGEPVLLPLGAHCWGEETDNGGAVRSTISSDSYESGVVVTEGAPDELQMLTISALNVFECDDLLCPPPATGNPPLAFTGSVVSLTAVLVALLATVFGLGAVLVSRRRESNVPAEQ